MTNGTSQGLFVVVAVVIFGIFLMLSQTIFGNTLQESLVGIFNDSTEITNEKLMDSIGTIPDYYVIATDSDFEKNDAGVWVYIGTDTHVIIPRVIQGEEVTTYQEMFKGTAIEGVASNNRKVTSMQGMFRETTSTSLDVTHLDTQNVKYMNNMFRNSYAQNLDVRNFNTRRVISMYAMFSATETPNLDLSGFDTRNVVNMRWMFHRSKVENLNLSGFNTTGVEDMGHMFRDVTITELDLRSFDIRGVNELENMFRHSTTTIGYARTQEDADILNGTSNKPEQLNFIVN